MTAPSILQILKDVLFGPPKPPRIEEESYPRDAMGRPDLTRFTKPFGHYTAYFNEYLESLGPDGPVDPTWQAYAYRKGVIGQWGIIARGPSETLPYVVRLLGHSEPEARSAAASILDAWSTDEKFLPHLLRAFEMEQEIETSSILAGTLGRLKTRAALPRMAELLRAPNSRTGDLNWSMMEAISKCAGRRFSSDADPMGAADRWLREQGF